MYADAITTVSRTYAEEIKTPFYGEGLDGLLRARSNSLRGIVNGIDYEEYNPATDQFLDKHYTISELAQGEEQEQAGAAEGAGPEGR